MQPFTKELLGKTGNYNIFLFVLAFMAQPFVDLRLIHKEILVAISLGRSHYATIAKLGFNHIAHLSRMLPL